jgi:hypothetical protein
MLPRPKARSRDASPLRHFERSRLETQLLASAYEVVVPVLTRPLGANHGATPPVTPDQAWPEQRRHTGG